MIFETLLTGAENPTTGKDLAAMFGCDVRDIQRQIEKERRDGKPICASGAGYFRAATQDELRKFCGGLKKRAGEMQKTSRLLLKEIPKLPTDTV